MRKGLVSAGVIILMGAVIASIVLAVPSQLLTSAGQYITDDITSYHLKQIEGSALTLQQKDEGYIELELEPYDVKVDGNTISLSYGEIEQNEEIGVDLRGPTSYETAEEGLLCLRREVQTVVLEPEAC